MILPVIMAGGSGSRLWPLSRQLQPKQFLPLVNDQSMLQNTIDRLSGLEHYPPLIICGEEHRFTTAEQLRQSGVSSSGIMLEPVGRNTAPAIALAALQALKTYSPETLLLVLPADHTIVNTQGFCEAVQQGISYASAEKLVTFGIVPQASETGYGYIKRGDAIGCGYQVDAFVEKPNACVAQQYVDSGEYYWNSGMFLFRADKYLQALDVHCPDILESCSTAFDKASHDSDFIRIDAAAFEGCREDSIDYAVMEKTQDAAVVPMDCGWSDVGSWSALWELSDKDDNGNVIQGDVLLKDSEDCYVRSDHQKLVAGVGLQGMVVVDSEDALLVIPKERVQDVKSIVDSLKRRQRDEINIHRKVYRPWGYYYSIDSGSRFQVKRIVVKPGAQLSLQMHYHRAEHWVVVSGVAQVSKGDETYQLTENQSTYIPQGVVHRLRNPGHIPLEIIEVQSGTYLGEDDIVRLEDIYGRT